jgi:stage II sporulation protein D
MKPATGYYYMVQKTYKKYSDASTVAKNLRNMGVFAYPAITYRNTYRVFIGGGSKSKVEDQYKKVKGKLGLTYSGIKADNQYRIMVEAGNYDFIIDIDGSQAFPQFIAKDSTKTTSFINLGKRSYRGRMEIGRYKSSSLTAVNVINIEEYLYGVVPSEMDSTWQMEALKAQAVCARGYAYLKAGYKSESNIGKPYTLCDTTTSQVYKGYTQEKSRTNQAVNLTKGETVCYNNKTVSTYYFSTSGGATEAAEDVWTGAYPYLRSVLDVYENNPEMAPWIVTMTKSELSSKLSQKKIYVGNIVDVFPEITTQSGRVLSLKIKGSTGSASLQKETVRTTFGLKSTKFKVIGYGDKPDQVVMKSATNNVKKEISDAYIIDGSNKVKKASQTLEQYIVLSKENRTNFPNKAPTSKNTYMLAGQGYGHGIGMSQSGANGMAKAGYNYKQILKYYFTGVTIE